MPAFRAGYSVETPRLAVTPYFGATVIVSRFMRAGAQWRPVKSYHEEHGLSTVLVTGAGGYVGGRLVETLLRDDWNVRALVREPAPRLDVEQIVFDLATGSPADLAGACRNVDTVVHLAGENEVDAAREPAAALASTVVATERVAEAAAEAGVSRLVYMSTVHVYGDRIRDGARLEEEMRPEPRAPYAISRLASEHLAAGLATRGFDLVIFRLTNSVGAPDHPEVDRWTLVANDLCRQGALDGTLTLRTSGMQWRDFIALQDVCAIVAASSRVDDPAIPAGTYNLGSGRPTTVRSLAEMIQDAFAHASGQRPELHALAPEAPGPEPYHVSIERLAGHRLNPVTPLEDAVAETVRFCIDHRKELS